MSNFTVTTARTADLDEAARAEVIRVCMDAHQEEDFKQLFAYLPPDGLHILGYNDDQLVSHAVVTTRWLQPEGLPLLKTAYVDAVATTRAQQGKGYGSGVMRHLAANISDYDIGCLESDSAVSFYISVSWEIWRGLLAGISDEGLTYTPEQAGNILILRTPRTPSLNINSLLAIKIDGRIW